ncbi:MAG: glycosyltransferase family 39 protein, partial [Gammaproteobacteria bacterium]
MQRLGVWPVLLVLWLVALLAGIGTRPLVPVDELRYIAVAWEMWQRGEFLVPILNGEPYSHKPPLFFWLIHAGWWLFGVNEWTARLLAPLLTLLSLYATAG